MKLTKKYAIGRRIFALVLAAAMVIGLAACGNSSGGETKAKEWVWVPEFVTIEDENVSYYDMQMVGDALCFISYDWDEETEESSQSICRYSLTDKTMTKTPLLWTEEGNRGLNHTVYGEDGSLYGVMNAYNDDYSQSWTYLCKFDGEGRQVFSQDMTELVGDSYVDTMGMDGQGRIYIAGESVLWLFDAEGNKQGTIPLNFGGNSWIRAMGSGKDGKMYICYYNTDGYELAEVDFEGKKIGDTYDNFPSGNSDRLVPGIDKDFLVHDGDSVYEYDMKSQKKEELFSWLDSDINGNYVQSFGVMEDGRILAVIQDWDSRDNSGIALLTKTKASEVEQKETIVIASMYGDYDMKSAAVKFNKTNSKYRVSIKSYVDYDNWDGNDYNAMWADALNRLNNDITSNNCPDIIDLSGLNVEQMAAKGIFEDLNGYLEKSSKLNRSDFLENILDAYTLSGTLISIPYSFQMRTVAGKASDVGTEMGWTVDELIAYADANSDAQLFDNVSKSEIMMYLMLYNADSFIDWSTGECHFDSPEFKSMLQFVNRFPDEVDWNREDISTPNKIQRGEVLLYEVNIYDFDEIQVAEEIFQGDASYIGYPTMDGSVGCMLAASQAYAITSKSGKKDGAWEFIESYLTKEENSDRGFSGWGFPTMKSKLEAMAADAVKVEYWTDENGELVLDENGEPIVMGGGSSFSYGDGWSYEYRIPTQEEVDLVMSLMEIAKPVSYSQGDEVLTIISEEAEAFYKGQKSLDDVASVIQSRVKIYVGENK